VRPPIEERFEAPAVMGVINVTPDSFSDGGVYLHVEPAVTAAWVMLEAGETSAKKLVAAIRREWSGYPLVREDYVAIVDPKTLQPLERVRGPALVAVAARVGKARLIDNFPWKGGRARRRAR